MKPSNRIALMFSLSTALLCGAALAQDPAATTAPSAAPAAPAPMAKHHHHHGSKAVHGVKYDKCLKENLADAQYYCSAHPDGCQAEKDGAAAQCRSEARGERQKG